MKPSSVTLSIDSERPCLCCSLSSPTYLESAFLCETYTFFFFLWIRRPPISPLFPPPPLSRSPARLRGASFRRRQGGAPLAGAPPRGVSEYARPRVGRATPAPAGPHVRFPAADGAQAQTV